MDDGRQFVVERKPLTAALGCGALGIGLAGIGYASGNLHFLVASLLPLALATALALFRSSQCSFALGETGLVLEDAPDRIPYEAIESLTLAGLSQELGRASRPGAIVLTHPGGVLEIPAARQVPSCRIYAWLLSRTIGSGSRAVNARLREFMDAESARFGDERVWTFAARRHLGRRPSTLRTQAWLMAAGCAGVAWIIAGAVLSSSHGDAFGPWAGFGTLLLVLSFCGWLLAWARQRHPAAGNRQWPESSLVISPTGIAMVQGDLCGSLRWDELREVGYRRAGKFLPLTSADAATGLVGLRLSVAGAEIGIPDVFDRPLAVIAMVIRHYWRGEPLPAPQTQWTDTVDG
jgi:hypothetical protein